MAYPVNLTGRAERDLALVFNVINAVDVNVDWDGGQPIVEQELR